MIRRMATLLAGSVSGQLLTLASSFLLTRLFSPEAFAHLELFALVTGIGAVLGTGKFEQAMMLPRVAAEAEALFWAGQRAIAITFVVTLLLVWPSASWVSERMSLDSWGPIAIGLPAFVAIAAHSRLLEYWHHRVANAGRVAWANGLGPLGAEATKLAASSVLPLSGLSWGAGIGLVAKWGIMMRGLGSQCQRLSPLQTPPSASVVRAFRQYPTWVLAGSVMNRLAQWLHVLLLGAALGPVMLGMLGLARRLLLQPLSLIAASAAPVIFQSATDKEDGAPLVRLFMQAALGLAGIAAVVWAAVWLAPDGTTAWLFGEPWREVMPLLRMLAPWFVLNFIAAGLGSMFHRLNRPRSIAGLDALHLLIVVAGWAAGTWRPDWFGAGEWQALQGIVYAKSAYYLLNIATLVQAVTSHRNAHRKRRPQ
jgi:O-antigen/teichoic acid export membrane protein